MSLAYVILLLSHLFSFCRQISLVLGRLKQSRVLELIWSICNKKMKKNAKEEPNEANETSMTVASLWRRLVMFFTSPSDPSNLAILRIMFGKVQLSHSH